MQFCNKDRPTFNGKDNRFLGEHILELSNS